jgi:hypothetical protein
MVVAVGDLGHLDFLGGSGEDAAPVIVGWLCDSDFAVAGIVAELFDEFVNFHIFMGWLLEAAEVRTEAGRGRQG